jgi:serine/threonine protein kinase/formylglycine-generating enzyme required for sulfatase activity/Leucine-rich repeat (LRR) protein
VTEEQIFLAALDLSGDAARSAYLGEICGGDAELRGKVEALLAAHFQSGQFMDVPAAEQIDVEPGLSHAVTIQSDVMSPVNNSDDEFEELSFLASSARPDSLGRIGKYEVLQVLGKGGFGIVFRAFDEVLQRIVAIKVLAPQMAATSPARKRFLREARASAQVRHENVVQVYEVGEQPLPHLAMEFIPGETLQQRLERVGPLDVPETLRIGRQIAEGLAAAHAMDLIHRDIKPGNVLLEGGQHKVKITDFGLARAADDASMTQSGQIAGTPMYMAPEQALGQTLDQRADLFSLGSVIYQMVAGRPPFRANSAVAVLKRVAEDQPRAIREIIPETPQWLCDIIAKLHAKNPDDRYQSAREVADVLAHCEEQLKQNSRLRDFSRIPQVRAAPRPSKRTIWVVAVVMLLLLVLGGVSFGPTAMLYLSNRGELKLLPEEGLISVIVLENNEGDLTTDKLHTPMTDWLDMVGKRQSLKLPPGRYQLNVGTFPAGTHVSQWSISTTGPFGSEQVTVPVINSSAIVAVERGQRVTLRPIISKPAAVPTPVVVANSESPASGPPGPEPVPPTFTNSLGMEFALVPKGQAWLGGGNGKPGNKEVEFKEDFYIGVYEVTQEEWEKVMGANPSGFTNRRKGGYSDLVKDLSDAELKRFPVEGVSWNDAQVFLESLNQRDKLDGWVYRLPTEDEWEYACRGGSASIQLDHAYDFYLKYPANELKPDQANYLHDNSLRRPCKVGSYPPNRLGLYDMHGNVSEWCLDALTDEKGEERRPIRGGSFRHYASDSRASGRGEVPPLGTLADLGLRLARVRSGALSPDAKTPPLAVAPFTDADVQRIAALPAAEQLEEVRKEFVRLNPGFDGKLGHKIEGDVVTELSVNTDQIDNIAPVRALAKLVYLDCRGTYPNKGKLSDLSPLAGMTLSRLDCSSTQVSDLSPLAELPLTFLAVNHNPVSDLSPVTKMPLESLAIAETKVEDLSPLKGMKIKVLGAQLLPGVTDLSPLQGMPLTGLDLYGTTRVTSLEPLRGMPLESLNLQDLPVSDLSPLASMTTLRTLLVQGNKVSDLSPLAGLKLTDLLLLDRQITDLSPLKGMPLVRLHIYGTGVSDLTSLEGMPLVEIRLNPQNIAQGLDILREIKSLQTIGIGPAANQAWPAAEFWERYDKGAFK